MCMDRSSQSVWKQGGEHEGFRQPLFNWGISQQLIEYKGNSEALFVAFLLLKRLPRSMEDNLRMGSNSKKSGAKKKKSSGKSSKSRPPTRPELEEAAPPRVDSTSPSKKRKSDEKQIPLEEKSGAGKSMSGRDQAAAKGKKSTSGSPTSREAWERQLRPRKLPKTFEDVRVGEADATRVIGRRLRVFWPLDDRWYSGLVKSFDGKKKRHHVVYDDGDEEWLELKKERVKILVAPGELFGVKPKENECEDGTTDINAPKQKESSSSSSGERKKSGTKRKRHSVVDIVKNDGRRKKEAQVKEEKQDSTQKNKLEEEETTMEGNAATSKVVDSEQVGSVDTHSERNEVLHNKDEIIVNKDSRENENEVEGKNSKKVKSSRRTAPRSKRGASARRTQATPITEHHIEDVHMVKQHKVGHSEAKQDIKLEECSKAAGNANVEDIIVPEVESIPNDDDDDDDEKKQQFCEQKTDSSAAEMDTVGDMDAKGSMKDVTKQAEKLDESATVAEQLEEQQTDDIVKPGNEDEPIRRTADQSSEKHLDVTVGDEKAIEKHGDVKDADQLNKKHNKKHRGKVKPREPVKK